MSLTLSSPRTTVGLLTAALVFAPMLSAQAVTDAETLPDAPSQTSAATSGHRDINPLLRPASAYDKFIDPGQGVPRLRVKDKIVMGLLDDASPIVVAGWTLCAGLEQVDNGKPHYGTNSGAYAERFGACGVRAVSEDIFSDAVLAPILREDPRYYIMGSSHGLVKRFLYAATRTLITRTDGGRMTPNLALIGGNAGGSALTQLYYPTIDRSARDISQVFVGSMGGSALGFIIAEFFTAKFEDLHLKRSPAQ